MHEYEGKSFEEPQMEEEETARMERDTSACISVYRIAKVRRPR